MCRTLIMLILVLVITVDKYSNVMAGPTNEPRKNESASIIVLNMCSQAINEDFIINPNISNCLNGT